jgi:hypothetical protein
MNGRQLAKAACECRRELKALFISGYVGSALLSHDDLGPGIHHVMTKPFTIEALATRINDLIVVT